jgi:hypothetical protein
VIVAIVKASNDPLGHGIVPRRAAEQPPREALGRMTAVRGKGGPSRFAVCRRVLWRPLSRWLLGVNVVLGILNLAKSELLPTWLQEHLQLIKIVALVWDLPGSYWLIGLLLVMLVATLEGSYQEVSALEPDRNRNAVAECRAAGVQLYARRVTSDTALEEWNLEYEKWFASAKECLAPFPIPTRLKFENLGPLPGETHSGRYNPAHNHSLTMLSLQLDILKGISDE